MEMLRDWLRIFVQVDEVSTFIHQTDGSISTTEIEVGDRFVCLLEFHYLFLPIFEIILCLNKFIGFLSVCYKEP